MKWLWLSPLAAASALAPLLAMPSVPPRGDDGKAQVAPSAEVGVLAGSGSCNGRGCHGAVATPGTVGSEYQTWMAEDPHAGAFLVLFNDRSRSIREHLRLDRPAHLEPLCQSCHGRADSLPGGFQLEGPVEDLDALAFEIGPSGVGCEQCHGPAGGWLTTHYESAWQAGTDEQKHRAGLTILRPSRAKAEACATCHVGDRLDRQVNHDLMAAGHPRLDFELTTYAARMPKHWNVDETDHKRSEAGQPPRSFAGEWAIGQLATLKAAADLARHRADAAETAGKEQPWPEFTEYGCYACHHANVDGGLRYRQTGAVPGAIPWNTWMVPIGRLLLQFEQETEIVDGLDALVAAMNQPYPMTDTVVRDAEHLSELLDSWLDSHDESDFTREDLRRLLRSIRDDPGAYAAATANWDAAGQLRAAMRALLLADLAAMAAGDAAPAPVAQVREELGRLDALDDALAFPDADAESPGTAGEPDPAEPKPLLEAIRALLDSVAADRP